MGGLVVKLKTYQWAYSLRILPLAPKVKKLSAQMPMEYVGQIRRHDD